MFRFRNLSIRRKQMFILMLAASVALLLACVAFGLFEVIAFRIGMVQNLSTLARIIGYNTKVALDFSDPKSIEETLSALKAEPHITGACVYNKDGEVFAQYDRANDGQSFTPPPRPQPTGHNFGRDELSLFEPVVSKGETIGVVYVVSDMRVLHSMLKQYAMIIGAVFLFTLVFTFLLSARLQRFVSEPILHLVQTARRVAHDKDYSVRAVKSSSDEIGVLIDGFNEMLTEIQERDAKLEQRVEERTRQLQQENSERHRAEQELLESRALYHSLVEQLPVGVFRKDKEGRYVFVNPWFCHLKKVKAEQYVGKKPLDIPSEDATPERTFATQGENHHEMIMRSGRQIEIEEQYPGEQGQTQHLYVLKSPVHDSAGNIVGSQGILIDITQRKRAETELERVHRQLLDTSRQAGMAEVATNVLHNVGNVLNSINVSTSVVADTIRNSRITSLERIAAVIREHKRDLVAYLTKDPRGKQLPDYVCQLAQHLGEQRVALLEEVEATRKHVEHIKEIVTMQQTYARVSGVTDRIKMVDLLEDALRMNSGALTRHQIEVARDYPAQCPEMIVDKHKALQILVNLIRNAKYACDDSDRKDKLITLKVSKRDERVVVAVADNGVGIPPENMNRIFNHGFTTRKKGHGFGLHSGANAAKEMGGSLVAASKGVGQGATFTLELPLQPPAERQTLKGST